MNKPKQNSKNKKQLLIDDLFNYINVRGQEQLQLKPDEFENDEEQEDFSLYRKEEDLEQYKKDYSSRIDRQINIISQNIMNSLFGLNNQKFSAFMSRYNVWGFDLTMQQFINSFYLVVKTDNMLRQFVLDHLDKIVNNTKEVMEKYLITHMSDFRFRELRTDYNKKKILDQIKKNQLDIDKKLNDRDLTPYDQVKTKDGDEKIATSPNTETSLERTAIQTPQPILELNNLNPNGGEEGEEGTEEDTQENRILSLNEIINGEQANVNPNQLPSIEDNLSGINLPQIQTPEQALNGEEPGPAPEEEEEEQEEQEQQSEEQQDVKQQILNDLRRQHSNLQQGFTNNG